MLIVTRRVGESITIGNDVKLTVLGVKGSQVRLGIDAPREIAIHRGDVTRPSDPGPDPGSGDNPGTLPGA